MLYLILEVKDSPKDSPREGSQNFWNGACPQFLIFKQKLCPFGIKQQRSRVVLDFRGKIQPERLPKRRFPENPAKDEDVKFSSTASHIHNIVVFKPKNKRVATQVVHMDKYVVGLVSQKEIAFSYGWTDEEDMPVHGIPS